MAPEELEKLRKHEEGYLVRTSVNFIKLTDVGHLRKYVDQEITDLNINIDSIEQFYSFDEDGRKRTFIHLKRVDSYHEVKETPEEIKALILATS